MLLIGPLLSGLSVRLTRLGVVLMPVLVFGLRFRRIDQADRDDRGQERGHSEDVTHLVTCS
jgi:hypothetical protein